MDSAILVVFQIAVVLFSIILHEVSHGFMAYSLGDRTAKDAGRLTLNPIPHIDLFGSILLPLFMLFLSSTTGIPFIFGYAKPVPYNPLNLRDRTYGPAKVAIAGPMVNMALVLLFALVLRFLPVVFHPTILPRLLESIVYWNLILAVFNLVPIPPLDGHWLLFAFLPRQFQAVREVLSRYSLFFFVIFILFLMPMLSYLINFLFGVIVG